MYVPLTLAPMESARSCREDKRGASRGERVDGGQAYGELV